MDEILTIPEIKARYPGEWVLVEDPENKESPVERGKVLCHSLDRDEVYRKAIELKPSRAAFLFFGDVLPKGMEAIL